MITPTTPTATIPAMSTSPWPLLGRDAELARLAGAIDDPGCGGVVLIGPAGVGKTRLAAYTIEMATARGLATSAIRATRSASGIPFAALAPLLPEIDLPTEASTALFRAAGEAIDARRGDGRFVLMVDDAQELDDASVALLDHLVVIGCVFVVLTVRREAASTEIAGSWLDERIHRIDLGPLADAEIRALATIGAGGPIEGSTMQTLVTASAGNPLFLRELVDGGLESGALVNQFGLWRLDGTLLGSPRLQDQVGMRVRGLPDDQLEALELVALGDPLELGLLTSLVPGDAVEQLERRGVLEASRGRMGLEVRLAHPLYGEAVRAGLSPVRRARLCRTLADAVEQQGSTAGPRSAAGGRLATRRRRRRAARHVAGGRSGRLPQRRLRPGRPPGPLRPRQRWRRGGRLRVGRVARLRRTARGGRRRAGRGLARGRHRRHPHRHGRPASLQPVPGAGPGRRGRPGRGRRPEPGARRAVPPPARGAAGRPPAAVRAGDQGPGPDRAAAGPTRRRRLRPGVSRHRHRPGPGRAHHRGHPPHRAGPGHPDPSRRGGPPVGGGGVRGGPVRGPG